MQGFAILKFSKKKKKSITETLIIASLETDVCYTSELQLTMCNIVCPIDFILLDLIGF